jgi:DNA-binding SARP family transcriptional activator
LARLDERWVRRLVTLVAGPGFGKTSLLVEAMSTTAASGEGAARRDLWLACEPEDEAPRALIRGLRQTCGLRPSGTIASLCAWVWSQAPTELCLVLDDVHELGRDSGGVDVLRQLLVELPRNGHVVIASRAPVPVPAARLATSGQFVRVTEADMQFDAAELNRFAAIRGVSGDLSAASGGWPALAELLATAGEDLVIEYLWDEVLQRVGPEHARLLSLFHAVGGGDDEIATAIAGRTTGVGDLLAGLPLVSRRGGQAVLHPLWGPSLRPLVTAEQVDRARLQAAEVHSRATRFDQAIQLQLDAEAWDDALGTMRQVAIGPALWAAPDQFERWWRALPPAQRVRPEAMLAAGLQQRAHDPTASIASFAAAATEFAARGDVDGEVAAIAHEGIVRWWANDIDGILGLLARLHVLADVGSTSASAIAVIGAAAIAQVVGDADGVLAALDGVEARIHSRWLPVVGWLRSVARRQLGDLRGAREELAAVADDSDETLDRNQFDLANWRIDWLAGNVEHVCTQMAGLVDRYRASGDRFLYMQTASELAAHEAWLGRSAVAAELLDATADDARRMPGTLIGVLRAVAAAAISIDRGADERAAQIIQSHTAAPTFPTEQWYWRDRAAMALIHVLDPPEPDGQPHPPAHLSAARLGEAVRALRHGDTTSVAVMTWPSAGEARANLPHRWLLELCAAGIAAGNPPPADLLECFDADIRAAAQRLAATSSADVMRESGSRAVESIPPPPRATLRIDVLGPLEVRLDGVLVDHPHLHRQRVRELLTTLVVRRKVRREQVAADLWPELGNAAHNLRVTLNYLQQVLQPTRPAQDLPYFVRTEGGWLTLVDNARINVDLWELNRRLDVGEQSDRDGDPQATIDHFEVALPMWRGDPLADLPDTDWTWAVRTQLIERYGNAATRRAELELAAGRHVEAMRSARCALHADVTNEAAHRVQINARLALGDVPGAHRALAECRTALATLALGPQEATTSLLAAWTPPASSTLTSR